MDLVAHWYRLLDDFRRIDDPALRLSCTGHFSTLFMEQDRRDQLYYSLKLTSRFPISSGNTDSDAWKSFLPHARELVLEVRSKTGKQTSDAYSALAVRAHNLLLATPSFAVFDELLASTDPADNWYEYVSLRTVKSFKNLTNAFESSDLDFGDDGHYPEWDICVGWDVKPLISATEYAVQQILADIDPPSITRDNRTVTIASGGVNSSETQDEMSSINRAAAGQLPLIRKAIAALEEKLKRVPTITEIVDQCRAWDHRIRDEYAVAAIWILEDAGEYVRPSKRGRKSNRKKREE